MSRLSQHSDAGRIIAGGFGCLNAAMAGDSPIENADFWRNRAEEARVMSERMVDAYTKFLMLGIADTYERIAKSYDLIAIFEQPLDTK